MYFILKDNEIDLKLLGKVLAPESAIFEVRKIDVLYIYIQDIFRFLLLCHDIFNFWSSVLLVPKIILFYFHRKTSLGTGIDYLLRYHLSFKQNGRKSIVAQKIQIHNLALNNICTV